MLRPGTSSPARLRLLAAAILACGLGLALLLLLHPPSPPDEAVGYVQEGGETFAVRPGDSRAFQRGLEQLGGKSGVLMTEIRAWLGALVSGRLPAFLVAGLAVAGAGLCLHLAENRPPPPGRP